MKYIEVKCNLPKEISEEFIEFLNQLQVEGYYEILFDSSIPKPEGSGILRDDTNISVYLSESDIEKELKIRVYLKLNAELAHFVESRLVETREFEDAYKEFYKPFLIGEKFCIIPTWEKESPLALELMKDGNKIPLYMNPGMAFGTGHHETTKLMLSRMATLPFQGKKILDMGTGSGILSIAAGLLGASRILAVDIDPNAVKATDYNWKENEFHGNVQFDLLEGGFDITPIQEEDFDMVLANITHAVISQNIRHIAKIRCKHFLFSGIITERKTDSIELFQKFLGGRLLYSEEFNEWEIIEWIRD